MEHKRGLSGRHSRTPSALGGYESSIGDGADAVLGKRLSTIPLLPGLAARSRFSRTYRRLALLLATAGTFVWLTSHITAQQYESMMQYAILEHSATNVSRLPAFSANKLAEEDSWRICQECSQSKLGGYITSDHARLNKPTQKRLRSGKATKAEVATVILQDIALASNLEIPSLDWTPSAPETAFMQPQPRVELFQNYLTNPDDMLSFSFAEMKPSLPTLYMFTRTADHGRLSGETRYRYMRRHVEAVKAYQQLVAKEGHTEASEFRGKDRQLLWLVIEDESKLDDGLTQVLKESGIPYLYIAHGASKRWGKVQWNIALKAVDVLRNQLFADGPILNVDDDAFILPELLRKVWKVKKVTAWQVGNFGLHHKFGGSQWEGPFYKKGKLVRWHYGGYPERTFRADMNGFAIDSSIVGDDKPIHGPQYAPHNNPAGENEFLEKILKSESEMEPLCLDTKEEKCYLAWHNHWMPQEQDETHPPPALPDFE